jgi:hypothetical protein
MDKKTTTYYLLCLLFFLEGAPVCEVSPSVAVASSSSSVALFFPSAFVTCSSDGVLVSVVFKLATTLSLDPDATAINIGIRLG